MPTREPLAVVNERMAAYNTHDMPAFLAAYSPEVAIYRYPDRLLGTGHTHLRRLFADLFVTKGVHVDVTQQIERQEYVLNDEQVRYGDKTVRYVSIYEVKNGVIVAVRFVGAD